LRVVQAFSAAHTSYSDGRRTGSSYRIASAIARPAIDVVHRPIPRRAGIFVPTLRDLSDAS